MLVECPKCGFSQPQDQYCAKCGVDMQSYRPRQSSLASRLIANPFFHISIVFVLVFAGSLYIMREQRQLEIARRVDYLKNGPIFAEPAQSQASSQNAADSASDEAQGVATAGATAAANDINIPTENSPSSGGSNPQTMGAATAATVSPRDPANESGTAEAANTTELKVTYALVPRPAIFRMVETGRRQGGTYIDFGEFQMGSLRNMANFLNGVDVLETADKKFLASLGEQVWFVGERSNAGELGITTRLALRGHENQELQGEVEVLRSMHESPEPSSPLVQKGYPPADFSLQPGQGLYLILVLPRVPQYDEARVSPTQFLRLYRMPDFKQKQSEFVMFLNFD